MGVYPQPTKAKFITDRHSFLNLIPMYWRIIYYQKETENMQVIFLFLPVPGPSEYC